MKRLYSNYPEYEFEAIAAEAEKKGLSLSAFQRYCVMVYMAKNTTRSVELWEMEEFGLATTKFFSMKPEATFTVADLFPNKWDGFSKSKKMSMAKRLVLFAKQNPHVCSVYQSAPGQTTVYIRSAASGLYRFGF